MSDDSLAWGFQSARVLPSNTRRSLEIHLRAMTAYTARQRSRSQQMLARP